MSIKLINIQDDYHCLKLPTIPLKDTSLLPLWNLQQYLGHYIAFALCRIQEILFVHKVVNLALKKFSLSVFVARLTYSQRRLPGKE